MNLINDQVIIFKTLVAKAKVKLNLKNDKTTMLCLS